MKNKKIICRVLLWLSVTFIFLIIITYFSIRPYNDSILEMSQDECDFASGRLWQQKYENKIDWKTVYIKSFEERLAQLVDTGGDIGQETNPIFGQLLIKTSDANNEFFFVEDINGENMHNIVVFIATYMQINTMKICTLVKMKDFESAGKLASTLKNNIGTLFSKSKYETIYCALIRQQVLAITGAVDNLENNSIKKWMQENLANGLRSAIEYKRNNLLKALRYQYMIEKSKMHSSNYSSIFEKIRSDLLYKEHELNYRYYMTRVSGGEVSCLLSFHRCYVIFIRRITVGSLNNQYTWMGWINEILAGSNNGEVERRGRA